jgi:NADPH:quinone reductase
MKAWLLKSFDGLDAMDLATTDDPQPAAGEVVLKVHYAALNPADQFLAQAQYPAKPPLPHILGRDGIGTIVNLGQAVTSWQIGQRALLLRSEIGVNRHGTFAELAAIPADCLVPPPPGWAEPEAAGAPLVYLTAYQGLTQWGDLKPSVILITGASGGVGLASIQLANAMGHTVLALSRNSSRWPKLKEYGAAEVFDPSDVNWPAALKKHLSGRRVDLAIDMVAGPLFPQVIAVLGDRGKVSVVGREAGPVPSFNTGTLFFRRNRIGGVAVSTYTPDEARRNWQTIVELLNRSGERPVVDSIFPFDQLKEGFKRLEEDHFGKVVLNVQTTSAASTS